MSTTAAGVPTEEELRRYEHQAAQAESDFAAAEVDLRNRYNRAAEDGVEERAEALIVRLADLKLRGISDAEARNLEALLAAVPRHEPAAVDARWQALQARQQALLTRQKALDAYGQAIAALEKRRQERVFRVSEAARAFERAEAQLQTRLLEARRAEEEKSRAEAETRARAEAEARMRAEAEARMRALEAERTLISQKLAASTQPDLKPVAPAPAPPPQAMPIARIQPAPAPQPAPAGPAGRKQERVSLDVDVGWESEHNFFTGWTENISEGGIFISTWQLKPKGTRVSLSFKLPGGAKVALEGEVAWVREINPYNEQQVPGMGIRFLSLSEDARRAIHDYIARRPPMFMV